VRFRLECRDRTSEQWTLLVDARDNATDRMIEYRTFAPVVADEFRLTVSEPPPGVSVGITDFSLFGRQE